MCWVIEINVILILYLLYRNIDLVSLSFSPLDRPGRTNHLILVFISTKLTTAYLEIKPVIIVIFLHNIILCDIYMHEHKCTPVMYIIQYIIISVRFLILLKLSLLLL